MVARIFCKYESSTLVTYKLGVQVQFRFNTKYKCPVDFDVLCVEYVSFCLK